VTRDRTLAWALFSVGLTAIVGQVLLLRELVATLYGNELLIGLILAAWLGWGAAGAGLAARRSRGRERLLAAGLAAAAVLLPAQLALARGLRTLLGAAPGSMLDLSTLVLAVVVVLAPLSLCLGALFSIGARLAVEGARTPGWAFVWDSIGSVVGGVLFSFVFVRWLDPFQTAFLVGGLDLAVAALLGFHFLAERSTGAQPPGPRLLGGLLDRKAPAAAIVLLAVLALAAFPLGRAAQSAALRLEWPAAASGAAQSLLFSGDSPYGRLAVQARGNQRIFYTDGVLAFETQSTFPEEVAHLALLVHPAPRDVLLIGGGIAGDLREILKHPVESVTYVELDPLLIRAAREYLPPADAAVLDDPRVRIVLTDGRDFVGRAGPDYDAIILDLPEPTTGALNRFYTVEFFAQARARLRPGGIFAFGLPSAENYWNPELARRNASIYRSLAETYPSVTVLPGEHSFFLAAEAPLQVDAGAMSARLEQRGIETRWVTPGYLRDLLTGDRFAQVQASVKGDMGARINRDLLPLSYYYSLALWLARSAGSPQASRALETADALRLGWLALPLGLAVLLARWKRRWALTLAVAGVGLAQMLLELVLLFAYQALHGSLYGEVSLLITAFMAGLALGGATGNRIARRRDLLHRALVGVLAGIAVFSALLPLLFPILPPPVAVPQWLFPPLAFLGGLLGGLVFPLASATRMTYGGPLPSGQSAARNPPSAISHQQSATGGLFYSADLAGGCVGALLGAALLIPILGIPQTCAAIALLAVAGLLAVL
jgi:spermidine synthase